MRRFSANRRADRRRAREPGVRSAYSADETGGCGAGGGDRPKPCPCLPLASKPLPCSAEPATGVARICLVAEEGQSGTVAGFVVWPPPDTPRSRVGVDCGGLRRCSGRGLRGRFLRLWEPNCGRTGVTEVMLEVRASNEAALGLYPVAPLRGGWLQTALLC